MSIPQQGDRQSRQSILQEIQQQKQQLLQQGAPSVPSSMVAVSTTSQRSGSTTRASTSQDPSSRSHPDSMHSSTAAHSRRIASEYASSHSNGYFVSVTDSQFGNHILPVIPRFDDS